MEFEKRFYSKENFIVLQRILNKITNNDYSNQENKNILFESMRSTYKTDDNSDLNNDTRFHNLK